MEIKVEPHPIYIAFGIEKIRRIWQLDGLMQSIHECYSDISHCYRVARSADEYVDRLKVHNSNNRAMVARNRKLIDEYNGLCAEWREFWDKEVMG